MDKLALSLNRALELFSSNRHYYEQELPCETDVAVMKLVDEFVKTSAAERQRIVAQVPDKYSGHLMSFALRMATLAVREKSAANVLQGLLALVIENFRIDWREDLMTLAPLNDAAVRVGADPVALFDEAASYATPDVAEQMRAFARRHPDLKALNVMGFSAQDTPKGFQYVFRWPKLPKASKSRPSDER